MLSVRVIPCLLLRGLGLVKTTKFKDPVYLGDPRNVVKIFNEKEVDELVLLDILATPDGLQPRFELIEEIVSEAFMPVGYGGGLRNVDDAKRMLQLGVEKVVVNSKFIEDPTFVRELADHAGSQSVVVCLDVKRSLFGKYEAFTHGGRKNSKKDPVMLADEAQRQGAGEILVNSIDRDGTMSGYDIELVRSISQRVSIPVIACGGAGQVSHMADVVREGGASAVAAGSMFVFQGKHRAVLISYPDQQTLHQTFAT